MQLEVTTLSPEAVSDHPKVPAVEPSSPPKKPRLPSPSPSPSPTKVVHPFSPIPAISEPVYLKKAQLKHHSSEYIQRHWLCCGKKFPDAFGCQFGDPMHHPLGLKESTSSSSSDKGNTQSWLCCGKLLGEKWGSNEGCTPGPHPNHQQQTVSFKKNMIILILLLHVP